MSGPIVIRDAGILYRDLSIADPAAGEPPRTAALGPLVGSCAFNVDVTVRTTQVTIDYGTGTIAIPSLTLGDFSLLVGWRCKGRGPTCHAHGVTAIQTKAPRALATGLVQAEVEFSPSKTLTPTECEAGNGAVVEWGGKLAIGKGSFGIELPPPFKFAINLPFGATADFNMGYEICCCPCKEGRETNICGCCVSRQPGLIGSTSGNLVEIEATIKGEGQCQLTPHRVIIRGAGEGSASWFVWNSKKKRWDEQP